MNTTLAYGYDDAGRLAQVTRNNIITELYGYDLNGNRTSATVNGVTSEATYDSQDRLLSHGEATYVHNANGDMLARIEGSQTTQYVYDELGNLTQVTLPSSITIDYLIDGAGRRVGKVVDGAMTQGFLWQDDLRIAAELDSENSIISRFIYATGINVPGYMIYDGVTYRIVTDHLGSVRLVVNVADGTIAQRLDYDAWGNVTLDTNPGFQPFGFAGGLYDPDTKLIHFGSRDYDARIGRWTSRDRIGFVGGDTNLYTYTQNDPVNFTDPQGTCISFLNLLRIALVALELYQRNMNGNKMQRVPVHGNPPPQTQCQPKPQPPCNFPGAPPAPVPPTNTGPQPQLPGLLNSLLRALGSLRAPTFPIIFNYQIQQLMNTDPHGITSGPGPV